MFNREEELKQIRNEIAGLYKKQDRIQKLIESDEAIKKFYDKLYPVQKDMVDAFEKNGEAQFYIKGRRIGMTTAVAFFAAKHCIEKPGTRVGVLVANEGIADNFIKILKSMGIPFDVNDNSFEVWFHNGSEIVFYRDGIMLNGHYDFFFVDEAELLGRDGVRAPHAGKRIYFSSVAWTGDGEKTPFLRAYENTSSKYKKVFLKNSSAKVAKFIPIFKFMSEIKGVYKNEPNNFQVYALEQVFGDYPEVVECCHCGDQARYAFTAVEEYCNPISEKFLKDQREDKEGSRWPTEPVSVAIYYCKECGKPTAV